MCFRCGAISHPGVNCENVGNAELREYIRRNDVVKCPNCGFGTEKI
jgi:DNA-directed RNA polymerase subunit RPC12/RpoP